MSRDPLLEQLNRIEKKQDVIIGNQEAVSEQIEQIRRECRRSALITGAASGSVAGGLVATTVEFLRIKFGG